MGNFAYNANSQQEADWLKARNKVLAITARAYQAVFAKLDAYRQAGRIGPMQGQIDTLEDLHAKWVAACDEAEAAKNAYVAFILAGGEYQGQGTGSQQAAGSAPQGQGSKLPSYTFPDTIDISGRAPAGFTIVNSSPGGSTGAMIVEKDGLKYVFKQEGAVSGEHIENEAVADQFYRAAGIRVPDCRTYVVGGKTYKLGQFIEGGTSLGDYLRTASAQDKERIKAELLEGYPIDVLLGNWDVIGMSQDNVIVDKDGHAWRIDNGSSFNFRAQGAKKKAAEWDNREFPDEWRTLRDSGNNKGVFGGYTTHDIWAAAGKIDFDALVAGLPPAQKTPSIVKCASEMKQMAARCADHDRAGYSREASSGMLDASYDLSKEMFRELVPTNRIDPFKPSTFGTCRTSRGGQAGPQFNGVPPTPPSYDGSSYSAKITQAAISINHHIASGDFQANANTIQQALALKGELIKAKSWDPAAKDLLDFIKQIEESQNDGFKKKIGMVPDIEVKQDPAEAKKLNDQYQKDLDAYNKAKKAFNAAQAKKGKPSFTSLTAQLQDYMKRHGADPSLISNAQRDQGSDSWYGNACRLKAIEMAMRGDDEMSAVKKGMFDGTGHSDGLKKWAKHYRANPAELDADKKTLEIYKAGVQLFLENADIPGNDRDRHEMFLIRTEGANVMKKYKAKKDTFVQYPIAPCESFGTGGRVAVYGGETVLVRVPYSRILGTFMLERDAGTGRGCFAGDGERETTADIYDNPNPVFYTSNTYATIEEYMKIYDDAVAKMVKI